MQTGFLQYYDLEQYLFESVNPSFHMHGCLTAFDFFCIVIWKANRAKTLVARRLLKAGYTNLETAVAELSKSLFKAATHKDRLHIMLEGWHFYLPMASAVLTILYPKDFTVYDVNVCAQLKDFSKLGNISQFETLWPLYLDFVEAVKRSTPDDLCLRDKDRYMIGKSFHDKLVVDLNLSFKRG